MFLLPTTILQAVRVASTCSLYPDGTLVGTLTGFQYVGGLCSDSNGNVWITNGNDYDRGGVHIRIRSWCDQRRKSHCKTRTAPIDCSWEPSSGNLARLRQSDGVAIYPEASGEPTYYSTVGFVGPRKSGTLRMTVRGTYTLQAPKCKPGGFPRER